MVDSVGLGSSVKPALQGVQRTSQQSNQTNERLSSGQRINDPLDGAEDFFTAQALTNRAADLAQVKDQVGQAISTIQATDVGLEAINDLSGQARAIAQQAQNTNDPTERARLADQFNQIRLQIDSIAANSGIGDNNLIGSSPDTLEVSLNEDGSSSLSVQGADSTSAGLGISARTFGSDADIDAALADISSAQTQVRSNSTSLSSNTSTLQNRIDFTDSLSNTLEQGAANLTQADLNEEAASLLSLQTRQALGANALTIATDNERAVLSLFS
jgi:flagellin-like hook-associated protein FlgL